MKKYLMAVLIFSCFSLTGCSDSFTYSSAEKSYAAGDYLKAAEKYDEIDSELPEYSYKDSFDKLNLCYMHLGDMEKEKGNYEDALEYYDNIYYKWEYDGVDPYDLKRECEDAINFQRICEYLKVGTEFTLDYGLFNGYIDNPRIEDIAVSDDRFIDFSITFYSDEFEELSDSQKILVLWYIEMDVECYLREDCDLIYTGDIRSYPIIRTDMHTYERKRNGLNDILIIDGEVALEEESPSIVPGSKQTHVIGGSSSSSTSSDKCHMCNGTGYQKYNYGGSDLEAILSGYDTYTTSICGSCGGTGKS